MEKKTIEITVYNQDDIPDRKAEANNRFSLDVIAYIDERPIGLFYDYDCELWLDCQYEEFFDVSTGNIEAEFTWVYAKDIFTKK